MRCGRGGEGGARRWSSRSASGSLLCRQHCAIVAVMTDPTKKPRRSRSEPTRAGAIHYLVHRSGEAWAVTSGGDNRASRLYESKAEAVEAAKAAVRRTEEHKSELQSLMRISYAVF